MFLSSRYWVLHIISPVPAAVNAMPLLDISWLWGPFCCLQKRHDSSEEQEKKKKILLPDMVHRPQRYSITLRLP